MAAEPRCILLAGAPDAETLRWEEGALLTSLESPFCALGAKTLGNGMTQATPSAPMSRWRAIKLGTQSNSAHAAPLATQFRSFTYAGGEPGGGHLDFLEHSIAVLDVLDSSQLLHCDPENAGDIDLENTTGFTTSFLTSTSDSSSTTTNASFRAGSPSKPFITVQGFEVDGPITNLKQIPTADHIASIVPQTITVNLLVGIVTVLSARTVQLKKRNAEMDIIELVVGDETRAGFAVSFWLAPVESQKKPADDLRASLHGLRTGDVVLLQNVALTCFRNCVYGQSLSKRFARNSTSISQIEDGSFPAVPGAFGTKLQRVRDWIANFVGVEQQAPSFKDASMLRTKAANTLPPDTQD